MNLTIPATYNDLTPAQFKQVQYILLTTPDYTRAQYRILKHLLKTAWYKPLPLRNILKHYPLKELWSYCDYIDHGVARTDFIELKIHGATYYPPIDKLFNLTAGSFSAADSLFLQFCEAQDLPVKQRRQYLEYLCGVLYEPTNTPVRPQFHKATLHERAQPFTNLRTSTLMCVLTSYAGCRDHLQNKFKYVFPKAAPVKKTRRKKSVKNTPGFDQIILSMAGDRIADLPAINHTPLYSFLAKMNNDLDPKNLKHKTT